MKNNTGELRDALVNRGRTSPAFPEFSSEDLERRLSMFARETARVQLPHAAKGKGNYGLGSGTVSQAERAGQSWVGEGYRIASDGKTLISRDGLRQFRPPSYKPNLDSWQANFEQRWTPEGQWQGNGHLDITDIP